MTLKPRRKPSALRHLVRHEHDSNKGLGWEVVINRRAKMHRRYFSDSQYGGKNRALAAAKEHRDSVLPSLPPALPVKTRNAASTTGVVGVTIVTKKRRNGRIDTYTRAGWPGGSISFSVRRVGMEEAWALAVTAREDALRRMGIENLKPLPPRTR